MSANNLPPFKTGLLPLDGIHTMYWEQSGNPDGQTVVLLHGGPGAGIDASSIQNFDTRHYRVITYDQRGAGRSTPAGCLENNTTEHLIRDLETLRQHLRVKSWTISGGSWGSALALAYAQNFPEQVSGLILRGIFLCQTSEIDWYFDGIRHFFPDAWRSFIEHLPVEQRNHAASAYYQLLLDPDLRVHTPAARQWCLYEARCATLLPDHQLSSSMNDQQCRTIARIQAHYFQNNFFMHDVSLLKDIERIKRIPVEIIQGRYDMICPPFGADYLKQLLPKADLKIVSNAGHSATEPGIRRALLEASEKFKRFHHQDIIEEPGYETTN
ncbi:prolyl aminopeptidase [bacterium]|nr:prolyl aminopeptidase [bacterium]